VAIKLNRIALEGVGLNPRRLAEAIHGQMGEISGAVPINKIALALDIQEIREERLTNITLITS